MDEEEQTARDYQTILAEQALHENKILFLPTGSGKTFIAIMVLKRLFYKLEPDFLDGGKRAIFLVNTVALVDQQANVLKRHLPVEEVGRYSGDMNLDFWDRDCWLQEFSKFQIMVMTAEILNQLLLKSYVSLTNLALLILDECHHAVEDHPMRQIMRLFEDCPNTEQPRVIGLTATLLNSNPKSLARVEDEVKKLEVTLHSTIATVNSWAVVKQFSTKPNETYLTFEESSDFITKSQLIDYITNKVNHIFDVCKSFNFVTDQSISLNRIQGFTPLYSKAKKNDIGNLVAQVTKQLGWLGLYGCSKTLVALFVSLRLIEQKMSDRKSLLMIHTINCHLYALSHLIESNLKCDSEVEKALKFSSPKVRKLINMLLRHFKKCSQGPEHEREPMQALIFVDEKMTAKILCSVLKNIARCDEFSFMKPGFMVGGSYNPFCETWEGFYNKQRNDAIVQRFRDRVLNILVCTDVLEEGIDIPLCNMVVRFDEVKTFRSYIQSKGRARHKNSLFSLMIPQIGKDSYETKISYFKQVENRLEILLVGHTEDRLSPSELELDQLYLSEIPPYITKTGSKVTLTSAIQLLNGYCLFLAHDRFSKISPSWHMKKLKDGKIQVAVELPKLSNLEKPVMGPPMQNVKVAKRAAALEASKELHYIGELDDFLMPNEKVLEEEDLAEVLPLWEQDDDDPVSKHKSGTKKRSRDYNLLKPLCYQESYPLAGKCKIYVHDIEIYPVFQKPPLLDSRKYETFCALAAKKNFAILSRKRLNSVCQFPVFSKFGEMNIKVKNCVEPISLSEADLMEVSCFHFNLFTSIIPIAKKFAVFSKDSILIACSTYAKDGKVMLDWAAMKNAQDEKEALPSLHCVVSPVHRGVTSASEVYLVTRVCTELNAESKFPNNSYRSFKDYFNLRHNFKINHPDLPLLEVQPFKVLSNDLLPRSRIAKNIQESDVTYFPIEAVRVQFSDGCLFLKACLLPSILHRLECLLVADDLRNLIQTEISLGQSPTVEHCELWRDKKCNEVESVGAVSSAGKGSSTAKFNLSSFTKTKRKQTSTKPWKDAEEPVDVETNFETVTVHDIDHYGKFIGTKCSTKIKVGEHKHHLKLPSLQKGEGGIKLLDISVSGHLGPHPCHTFEATCAASADDMCNLERLETLGDSFLKFAVSIFLFNRFPKLLEGKLTQIKGQVLGNRNLFYCAKAKKLANYLKVHKVVPAENWTPPSFSLPECLEHFPIQFLRHHVVLSDEQRFDGTIKESSLIDMEKKKLSLPIIAFSNEKLSSSLNVHLNIQQIPDKTVADGVEALIGLYLKTCGPKTAMLFLEWMKILPKGSFKLLEDTANSGNPLGYRSLGYSCKDVETNLGYTFKNKNILLEALTHASSPAATSSYERLEFIGDAVLDFLITAYMYENCGELTPGQMTDLRSALVNNITFACLTVRHGYYKFLNAGSPALLEAIDRFVRFQEEREHVIDEEVLVLLEEKECKIAETVDVPKALGDLFEALIGAVYLDSGRNLSVVWSVVYRIMQNEISDFSKNPPLQVVRRLHETFGSHNIDFRVSNATKETLLEQVFVVLTVPINGSKMSFNGFGVNKAQAKKSAAKLALRELLYNESLSSQET